ncbi:MAG: penicillin acylase family protein [Cyclobacteriaceae bacterium]|nr:penicillin acylase family protein [Cyclobacteriaceae bacterium]
MKNLIPFAFALLIGCTPSSELKNELTVVGLEKAVEIIRDEYGVNHIYAQNEHDLFFAQGYSAAKDRLFQFELWRRQASGTVSEILGERELKRDVGVRLFKYRGDLEKEFNHYHPHGVAIITAFTEGINAYVAETEKDPSLLTLEFQLLGIKAGRWTPELVVSRHQGLLGNLPSELTTGRAVALLGADQVKKIRVFEPGEPTIALDSVIDPEGLLEDIVGPYEAFREPLSFQPEDLAAYSNPDEADYERLKLQDQLAYQEITSQEHRSIGSNNWIVSGSKSESGFPMLANDPHRSLAIPSLRYMVHLNAPGWNVVGGGEPTIPGVSIGHNEFGAWGLTVFGVDGEDIMVYDLNPKNLNQYKYKEGWEEMTSIKDTIHVKGADDVFVEHKYTRHGPVTFVDTKRNKAYAVRCGWMEPGGAPYMASLRMNGAKTWEEFSEACSFSHLPGENMIWADKAGNIGWQAVGISPIRKNWDGLVPVPGDGRYEWDGFLPIKELPNTFNPEKGFWVTANESLVPKKYPYRNAVGWEWADSSRSNRINEVLASREKHSQEDMRKLQVDYTSLPARQLIPYLNSIKSTNAEVEKMKQLLLTWDFVMDKNSISATIYSAWERKILERAHSLFVPEKARGLIKSISLKRALQWIKADEPELKGRNQFLLSCLKAGIEHLHEKLGDDETKWQYGQPAYHHVLIKHPLSNAANDSIRSILECGPVARGGSGSTPGVTGNGDNQSHGATFRMIADASDWDKTLFTNSPGQSGDPESSFYKNLFELWASDQHFPVYFSKEKVNQSAKEKIILTP